MYVIKTIISEIKIEKRVKKLEFWIKLASQSLELHDTQTSIMVLSALNSVPVHRLKITWSQVKKKTMKVWEFLQENLSHRKNYNQIRIISRENLASVLYLGVPLTGSFNLFILIYFINLFYFFQQISVLFAMVIVQRLTEEKTFTESKS